MYYYIFSGLAGAFVAILIAVLARSHFYVLAGLAPLFPTFALFAHFLTYQSGGEERVREVALFGAFSVLPYLAYILVLYFSLPFLGFKIGVSLGLFFWFVFAASLHYGWNHLL